MIGSQTRKRPKCSQKGGAYNRNGTIEFNIYGLASSRRPNELLSQLIVRERDTFAEINEQWRNLNLGGLSPYDTYAVKRSPRAWKLCAVPDIERYGIWQFKSMQLTRIENRNRSFAISLFRDANANDYSITLSHNDDRIDYVSSLEAYKIFEQQEPCVAPQPRPVEPPPRPVPRQPPFVVPQPPPEPQPPFVWPQPRPVPRQPPFVVPQPPPEPQPPFVWPQPRPVNPAPPPPANDGVSIVFNIYTRMGLGSLGPLVPTGRQLRFRNGVPMEEVYAAFQDSMHRIPREYAVLAAAPATVIAELADGSNPYRFTSFATTNTYESLRIGLPRTGPAPNPTIIARANRDYTDDVTNFSRRDPQTNGSILDTLGMYFLYRSDVFPPPRPVEPAPLPPVVANDADNIRFNIVTRFGSIFEATPQSFTVGRGATMQELREAFERAGGLDGEYAVLARAAPATVTAFVRPYAIPFTIFRYVRNPRFAQAGAQDPNPTLYVTVNRMFGGDQINFSERDPQPDGSTPNTLAQYRVYRSDALPAEVQQPPPAEERHPPEEPVRPVAEERHPPEEPVRPVAGSTIEALTAALTERTNAQKETAYAESGLVALAEGLPGAIRTVFKNESKRLFDYFLGIITRRLQELRDEGSSLLTYREQGARAVDDNMGEFKRQLVALVGRSREVLSRPESKFKTYELSGGDLGPSLTPHDKALVDRVIQEKAAAERRLAELRARVPAAAPMAIQLAEGEVADSGSSVALHDFELFTHRGVDGKPHRHVSAEDFLAGSGEEHLTLANFFSLLSNRIKFTERYGSTEYNLNTLAPFGRPRREGNLTEEEVRSRKEGHRPGEEEYDEKVAAVEAARLRGDQAAVEAADQILSDYRESRRPSPDLRPTTVSDICACPIYRTASLRALEFCGVFLSPKAIFDLLRVRPELQAKFRERIQIAQRARTKEIADALSAAIAPSIQAVVGRPAPVRRPDLALLKLLAVVRDEMPMGAGDGTVTYFTGISCASGDIMVTEGGCMYNHVRDYIGGTVDRKGWKLVQEIIRRFPPEHGDFQYMDTCSRCGRPSSNHKHFLKEGGRLAGEFLDHRGCGGREEMLVRAYTFAMIIKREQRRGVFFDIESRDPAMRAILEEAVLAMQDAVNEAVPANARLFAEARRLIYGDSRIRQQNDPGSGPRRLQAEAPPAVGEPENLSEDIIGRGAGVNPIPVSRRPRIMLDWNDDFRELHRQEGAAARPVESVAELCSLPTRVIGARRAEAAGGAGNIDALIGQIRAAGVPEEEIRGQINAQRAFLGGNNFHGGRRKQRKTCRNSYKKKKTTRRK